MVDFLTPDLLFKVKDIVRKAHLAFIANAFGPDALPSDVMGYLHAKGLVGSAKGTAEDAYVYGAVLSALPEAKDWTPEQFADYLSKHPVQLTAPEKRALIAAQMSTANYVVGLGNTVDKVTGQVLVEADAALREKLRQDIANANLDAVAFRETASAVKSNLGHAMQDWTRDLDRIVRTEKHAVMSTGVAENIKVKHGPDALVAILCAPDACPSCRKLHIGPDGHPRIFKLSSLSSWANVGKKQSAWVPGIPPVHPHCQCQLVRVPAGWGFNKDGDLAPGATGGVLYEDGAALKKALIDEDDYVDRVRKAARKLHDRMTFRGLKISIENGLGTERTWIDHDGSTGVTPMMLPYGYIRMTEAVDGDHVDVFVGQHEWAPDVYIVHTRKKLPGGGFGGYDEDKVFLGLGSAEAARAAFHAHYNDPGFFGGMSIVPFEEFKAKVLATKDNPAAIHAVPGEHVAVPAIRKSGEGSRGGHVVGHTAAGEPIYAGSAEHTRVVVEHLREKHGVGLDVSHHGNMLTLSRIVVPKEQRGKGTGSKVMQELHDHADAHGLSVALSPSSDFGGSKGRLTKFYGGFGYKPNSGSKRDFTTRETMIRRPEAKPGERVSVQKAMPGAVAQVQSSGGPAGSGGNFFGNGPWPYSQPADVSGHKEFLEAAGIRDVDTPMSRDKHIYEAEHVDDVTWEGLLQDIVGPTGTLESRPGPDPVDVANHRSIVEASAARLHSDAELSTVRKSRPARVKVVVES